MDEDIILYSLVNNETGEIINEFKAGDKLIKISQEQKDFLSQTKTNFNKGEKYTKVFDSAMPILIKKLSDREFKFLFLLINHVSYEDCIIRKCSTRNSSTLNLKELSDVLGLKYDYVRKIVPSLIKKGIMGKHITGNINNGSIKTVYTINPYIFFKGTNINKTIYEFYNKSGWDKDTN